MRASAAVADTDLPTLPEPAHGSALGPHEPQYQSCPRRCRVRMSKAEPRRVQHRTRAAKLVLATDGRWLGGRVNYGYRLIDTGLPHPKRSKAAAGPRLRTLEPDPETAPVVRRIFEPYDEGNGFRSIARILESEGLPSPAKSGRSVGIVPTCARPSCLRAREIAELGTATPIRRHIGRVAAKSLACAAVGAVTRGDPQDYKGRRVSRRKRRSGAARVRRGA